MDQTQKEQIIVRGTGEYWQYSIIRGGFLRVVANAVEDNFAAFGRTLLLFFLIYCGMKGAALLVAPGWAPPLWLELVMFGLQVGGLEGGIPGLSRRRLELREKGDEAGVRRLSNTIGGARFMNIAAVAEGVLHLMFGDTHGPLFGVIGPDAHYMQVISGILLVVRVWIIIDFLMELAQVDAKGPRIVSKEVFEKEQTKQEQEDGRVRQIAELKEQLLKTAQERNALSDFQLFLQKQSDIIDARLQQIENSTVQRLSTLVAEIENLKGFQVQIESGFQEYLAESLLPVVERLQSHEEHLSILPAITEQIGQLEEATQYQLRSVTEEFSQVRVTLEQHTMQLPRLAEKLASVSTPSQPKPKQIARGKSAPQIAAPKKMEVVSSGKWTKEQKEQFVFECLQEDSEMSISAIQQRASERGQELSIGSISGYRKAFQSRVVESDFEGPDTGEFESVVFLKNEASA